MEHPVQYIIDEAGLAILASEISTKMGLMITTRTTNTIDENSDTREIPSAQAVFNLLKASMKSCSNVGFTVVANLPTTGPTEGNESKFHLIKVDTVDPSDEKYKQYVWVTEDDVGKWISLGVCEVDLEGYWNKDNLKPIPNSRVIEIIQEAFEG